MEYADLRELEPVHKGVYAWPFYSLQTVAFLAAVGLTVLPLQKRLGLENAWKITVPLMVFVSCTVAFQLWYSAVGCRVYHSQSNVGSPETIETQGLLQDVIRKTSVHNQMLYRWPSLVAQVLYMVATTLMFFLPLLRYHTALLRSNFVVWGLAAYLISIIVSIIIIVLTMYYCTGGPVSEAALAEVIKKILS